MSTTSVDQLAGTEDPASIREVAVAGGSWLFREGDPGDAAYLVLAGEAGVYKGAELVSRVAAGQVFGERALVGDGVRTASVRAEGDLKLLRIEASTFLRMYAEHPKLRSLVGTLAWSYRIPDVGVLTLHEGEWNGEPCITTVQQAEGRTVTLTRAVDRPAFQLQVQPVGTVETITFERSGLKRSIGVCGDQVVALQVEGEWSEQGDACDRVLRKIPVRPEELTLFRRQGRLADAESSLLCPCMRVTREQATAVALSGKRSAEALAEATGAGRVCGACVPLLEGLVSGLSRCPHLAAVAPPLARPGAQAVPVLGTVLAGLATARSPIDQARACRETYGDVFTLALPGNPPITYVLGEDGYAFFNRLPVEDAGIGAVLQIVPVFGRWLRRSDPTPAWLEQLALGGRAFLQGRMTPPYLARVAPVVASEVAERVKGWGDRIDLNQELIGLVHRCFLRVVLGEATWERLPEGALALLRRMVAGVDVPRLAVGATPARFLMDDFHATRALEKLLADWRAREPDLPLLHDLREEMRVGGARLREGDEGWAMAYVLFNACAYPGSYGFWSMVDILCDASTRDAVSAGDTSSAEHALLETLRLDPVTVAGRTIKKELRYETEGVEGPVAWSIPTTHMLGAAPASFTRDPKRHADPDRYCPHRFNTEPVPELFGGGPFGCVAQGLVRSLIPAVHVAVLQAVELELEGEPPHRLARPALHYPKRPLGVRVRRR